jgi:MazG family protein
MTAGDDSTAKRASAAFAELTDIVHRLRAPGGCPWDREQTAASLKPYVIEEAYEVVEAIDGGRPAELREELGDLLLQVALQSEIAAEQGAFDVEDVVRGISRKLIGRHPHVFGEVAVDGAREVLVNWEKIKQAEKRERGLFDGLPSSLPGLLKAARMGEKAGRVGFDWAGPGPVRDKVAEELAELDEAVAAGDPREIGHELGDLLFAVAQWARHLGQAPEEALREGCRRFRERFERMERALRGQGVALDELDPAGMERAWRAAKAGPGDAP